jgi:uncharacterized protein (DUF433 family)
MPRIVLNRPHTHAGQPYPAGERITVDADIADWLIANGIAEREALPPKTDFEPKSLHRKDPKS